MLFTYLLITNFRPFYTLGAETFNGGATAIGAPLSNLSSISSAPTTFVTLISTPTLTEVTLTTSEDYDPYAPWTDIPYISVPSILPQQTEITFADMPPPSKTMRKVLIFLWCFCGFMMAMPWITIFLLRNQPYIPDDLTPRRPEYIQMQNYRPRAEQRMNANRSWQTLRNRETSNEEMDIRQPGPSNYARTPVAGAINTKVSLMGTTLAAAGPSRAPRLGLKSSESLLELERALLRD